MADTNNVEFVRYNSGLGGGPFDWTDDVRMIGQGMIFAVTDEGRPAVLRYLHGDESQRTYLTPVEADYVASLRHCTSCGVYFERLDLEQRHVRYHEQRQNSSVELTRLARLDQLDDEDKRTVREAEARIFEREEERRQLQARVADLSLMPAIVGSAP